MHVSIQLLFARSSYYLELPSLHQKGWRSPHDFNLTYCRGRFPKEWEHDMVCPNCGNVTDDKNICDQCGAELASPPATTAPASGGDQSPATVSPLSDSGVLAGMT